MTSNSTINHLSEEYECLTVLFADMVAFTKLCRNQEPRMIMHMLNDLFESFDAMLPLFDVEKIETVGDCYVLVGGMTGSRAGLTEEQRREEDRIGVRNVLNMAKAMIATAKGLRRIDDGAPIQLRIGIHSGPCVSGVIGIEKPRLCLFGDTINVASRMESTGAAGRIHVSKQTAELVPEYRWEPVPLHIKGKGEMETFFTQDVLTPRTSLAPIDG
uniref:Guanylate cyclase domain-containing protein n=1 Tax=Chloropicon laureae TaxID=464258 RepID=A0A7S3E5F2_9CHLO